MRCVRIGDLGRRIGQRQFAEHQRHQRPLRQPAHNLPRRIAQHAHLVPHGLMHGPVQVSRLVDRVCVGKQQPSPPRLPRRRPNSIRLPRPAGLQLIGLHHGDSGKTPRNLGGAIGRVVVHHNQFPVAAQLEDLLRLRHQRLQARSQAFFLIPRRNNDRKLQQLLRLRLVIDRAGPHRHRQARPARWKAPAPASMPSEPVPSSASGFSICHDVQPFRSVL